MHRALFSASRTALVLLAMLAMLSLAFQAPLSATGPVQFTLTGTWDRLNPDQSGPSPEHEVLRCGGIAQPLCVYDKHPEPLLNFTNPPDSTIGYFRGQDVTVGWQCPNWFPSGVCSNTAYVAAGTFTYYRSNGTTLVVNEQLIVTDMSGQGVLYLYWVDYGFACPWYRSFAEALAANPFPLPFNGQDWPQQDCF